MSQYHILCFTLYIHDNFGINEYGQTLIYDWLSRKVYTYCASHYTYMITSELMSTAKH